MIGSILREYPANQAHLTFLWQSIQNQTSKFDVVELQQLSYQSWVWQRNWIKGCDISMLTPQRNKKARVFPLHMTSFEHYMLADDRPSHPMCFVVQLEFSGCIQRAPFEEAVQDSLARHPLLTAIIGPGKGGKDCWVKGPGSEPFIDWKPMGEPIRFPVQEFIDIRAEPGLRIFVREDNSRAIITAQFHHASCDGIGSYQFLGDVLYYYAKRTGDSCTEAPMELCSKRLRSRSSASYNLNNFRLANGKYQRTWDEALKHLLRSNIVLKSCEDKSIENELYPAIQSHTFEKDEYKQLRLHAQSKGQVLNDMLVENLFATLHQWNRTQPQWHRKKHACVMMPMNLREVADHDISACNIVAHAFLRRTEKQLAEKNSFRKRLASDLLHLKSSRHKIRFMHMIAGGHYFYPRMLKWSLDWKRSLATAILSNTGDPTKQFLAELPRKNGAIQCGNLVLEDISGVPPLRPGTNATISIFTYRRKLKICLRCDPKQFSVKETEKLLTVYVKNLVGEIVEMQPTNRLCAA